MIEKEIKEDFLKISNGNEWNEFMKKYKGKIEPKEFDNEMNEHLKKFLDKYKKEENFDYQKK